MATFNGSNIVPMPVFPAVPRSIEWQASDIVAMSTSPFTAEQQIQNWQAAWLEASLYYQPMNNSQALAWMTWLMAIQGTANVFQFGDPLNTQPQNPGASAPSVAGPGQTGYSLSTSGGSGQTPGDWIQIGYRLYRIISLKGGGVFGIWPQIRESPSDGAPVIITNTQGIWRLKSNTRKWSVNQMKVYGFQFEIREAL